ncbi:MAG: N-formylglutamate amidohydrolase [Phenylobacterium sp.]
MMRLTGESRAGSTEPHATEGLTPFAVEREDGASPLVLICDHAGRAIPAGLSLGVASADMDRHIAWDIGVAELGRRLSMRLDACLVTQPYSRLAIDCNRSPERADAVPETSDGTEIPGNRSLSAAARQARVDAIHTPYHRRIETLLDSRSAARRGATLLFLHSFTPSLAGVARPWRFGVLHTGEAFALALLAGLRAADLGEIGDNAPYAMDDTDYTAARHGRRRGLDFAELEVRQDLIAEPAGAAEVAAQLAPVLTEALAASGL